MDQVAKEERENQEVERISRQLEETHLRSRANNTVINLMTKTILLPLYCLAGPCIVLQSSVDPIARLSPVSLLSPWLAEV